MNGERTIPLDLAWLAAVLEPRDVAPHPNFPDDSYDARPAARVAAVMMGDPWRARRASELAPDVDNDPAAMAARCLHAETIASGVAELGQRLESLDDGTDLAESSALTLILCAAASELDDFDTCVNALDRQLRRLEHPANADQSLLRAVLLQQRALRLCDTGEPYLPVSLEVGRLLRDLDPSACSAFTTGPGGPRHSTVTLRHIYRSLIDSVASLPGASAADELKAVGLPTRQDRLRGTTPSLIRRKNNQDALRYAEFVSKLFKRQFGGGGNAFGVEARPDTFYSVLALEVAGHGAVYYARKELALLRLVQWSGDVHDLADTLRLLRQAAAKDELELALRRLADSGPLTALGKDARQILRTRTMASRLRTVELSVLRSAADLLAPTEARFALDSVLALLSVGGPPDLPGSWQLPLLRQEAAWITAAAMANVCDAVDEVAQMLLAQAHEIDSRDQLFDNALRRAATTLDWSAASPNTREVWRHTLQERSEVLPATSESVLIALGDAPVQPSSGAAPFDDLTHRLNLVIRGQAEASEIGKSDVARVEEALGRIRRDASNGMYAMGGISESDVAAALVTEIGLAELLFPLTEFLLDPDVARRHKTPAFERLARARLELPAAVAGRFRAEALPLLNSTGPELFESQVVPYPAALRFLGAYRLRDGGEILGLVSALAASPDRHARREAAVTISVLGSVAPSPPLLALCVSLSRDDDVEVRANAGRGLAMLRKHDDSLEGVATGRLIDLLDEDGLRPPLVVMAALEDLADLPPAVTDKIRQLVTAHPSRSVRTRAADLLQALGG